MVRGKGQLLLNAHGGVGEGSQAPLSNFRANTVGPI